MGCHRGCRSHANWLAAENQKAEVRILVLQAELKQMNGNGQEYTEVGQIGIYMRESALVGA